jgi:hypothetical protein
MILWVLQTLRASKASRHLCDSMGKLRKPCHCMRQHLKCLKHFSLTGVICHEASLKGSTNKQQCNRQIKGPRELCRWRGIKWTWGHLQ